MYFSNFDSFAAAVENAKWIEVKVALVTGSDVVVRVTIEGRSQLFADIAVAHEMKTNLVLWDLTAKRLIDVVYGTILLITIKFDTE